MDNLADESLQNAESKLGSEADYTNRLIPTKTEIKDILHKELDLIQGAITRMASNSFQCKSWLIGLLTFVLALSKESVYNMGLYALVLLLPILVFWYLDGFFLYVEQRYRDLYKYTIHKRSDGKYGRDHLFYDMNFTSFEHKSLVGGSIWDHYKLFRENRRAIKKGNKIVHDPKINIDDTAKSVKTIVDVMLSKTLKPFYYLPIAFVLFVSMRGVVITYIPYFQEKTAPLVIQLDTAALRPVLQAINYHQNHNNTTSKIGVTGDSLEKPIRNTGQDGSGPALLVDTMQVAPDTRKQ